MNIPARYCTGYLGDIGVPPPYAPMDFSAWFEVYLGGRWHTFDARHNIPRIGRVLMARGRDAADVAIATTFGPEADRLPGDHRGDHDRARGAAGPASPHDDAPAIADVPGGPAGPWRRRCRTIAAVRSDEPAAARGHRAERGAAPLRCVLLCEHASNFSIAAEYAGRSACRRPNWSGTSPTTSARRTSRGGSRSARRAALPRRLLAVLIDLNRPWRAPSSIPEISEATVIPGNIGIDAAERARRQAAWFTPFHDRVAAFLETRPGAVVIGVHSFTPVYLGEARPWHAGILYGEAARFGTALVRALAADPALVIGDNEPYRIDPDFDYTVPVHGDAAGRDAVLLEVRQDLLGDDAAGEDWARRLAAALQKVGEGRGIPSPNPTLPFCGSGSRRAASARPTEIEEGWTHCVQREDTSSLALPSSGRRRHRQPAHLVLLDEAGDEAGGLGLLDEVAQQRGAGGIAAGGADRLLHGGELAVQDAGARQLLDIGEQPRPQPGKTSIFSSTNA